jgi:hypothetical protein
MNQTTPDRKELYAAIGKNDADRLAQLCSGIVLSTFSDKEQSDHRITEAIQSSAGIPVLQVLVNCGVDPHEMPKRGGFSPLRKAIQLQRIDCLKYLLDLGVDPNSGLEDQRITLSAAGHSIPAPLQLEMLKLLVQHGVDINFQFTLFGDKQKLFTLLDHATHPEVNDYLRSVGAKTSAELAGH